MVVDAFCPECREDLSATVEEVAAKPTLAEMANSLGEPVGAVGALVLGYFEVILTLGSLIALFAALRAGEWKVAGGAAVFVIITVSLMVLKVVLKVRGSGAKTSVTGRDKTSKGTEQPE